MCWLITNVVALVGMRRSDDEQIPTLGFLGRPHVEASSLLYRTVPYVRPFARVARRGGLGECLVSNHHQCHAGAELSTLALAHPVPQLTQA